MNTVTAILNISYEIDTPDSGAKSVYDIEDIVSDYCDTASEDLDAYDVFVNDITNVVEGNKKTITAIVHVQYNIDTSDPECASREDIIAEIVSDYCDIMRDALDASEVYVDDITTEVTA
jgi:hypothetical protein